MVDRRFYDFKTAAYGADFARFLSEILRRHLKPSSPQSSLIVFGISSVSYPNNYLRLTSEALKQEHDVIGPHELPIPLPGLSISEIFTPYAKQCSGNPCLLVDMHISSLVSQYLEGFKRVGATRQFYAYPNPLTEGNRGGVIELIDNSLFELSPIGRQQLRI